MQLAIYETEHFETAYALIRLFDLPGNTITIFTTHSTSERLHEMLAARSSSYKWILQGDNESNRQFIRKMYASVKLSNPDIFVFGTVSHNYLLHALLMRTSPVRRFLLTVHEVNTLFRPRFRWGIKKTGNFIGKKSLTRSVKEYISILDTLLPAINDCVPPDKKIHSLSGAIFENDHTDRVIQQPVKIVVPGTIERSRRDYRQVVSLLDAAKAIGLQLEITLPGMAKEKMQHEGIVTYSGIVPQPEFDRMIREAHFIFAPIVHSTVSPDGMPEIYGSTKVSGNVLDIIRYAKPAFIPHHLAMPANLESACIRCRSAGEMATYIAKMLETPDLYRALQQKAFGNSLNYTVEKIRSSNPELFN